jgi:hypothetical protein
MKVACSFETTERIYPNIQDNNPEDLIPQYENRFTTNKIYQRRVISSRYSGNLAAILVYRFSILSFPLASYTSDKKVSCYYRRFTGT